MTVVRNETSLPPAQTLDLVVEHLDLWHGWQPFVGKGGKIPVAAEVV